MLVFSFSFPSSTTRLWCVPSTAKDHHHESRYSGNRLHRDEDRPLAATRARFVSPLHMSVAGRNVSAEQSLRRVGRARLRADDHAPSQSGICVTSGSAIKCETARTVTMRGSPPLHDAVDQDRYPYEKWSTARGRATSMLGWPSLDAARVFRTGRALHRLCRGCPDLRSLMVRACLFGARKQDVRGCGARRGGSRPASHG
jgi:hypothetical protein